MSSRESALGAWADKIPRVDGNVEAPNWNELAVDESPLTDDDVAHEMKQGGKLLLMGLAPVLLAGFLVARDLPVLMHGESTTGTIVDQRRGPRRSNFPVAIFYAYGQRYRVRGDVSVGRSAYVYGDPIPVVYHSDEPNRAIVGPLNRRYIYPMILTAVGLTFVFIAVGGWVYVLRKHNRQQAAGT